MSPWEAAQAVQRSAYDDAPTIGATIRWLPNSSNRRRPAAAGPGRPLTARSSRGLKAAIARAMQLVGHNGYYRLCARLAANIWGRPRAGYLSAAEQWDRMVAVGNAHSGDRQPPVGALIFWATDGPYGHVAVYVGGGRIVSNDIEDKAPGAGGGVVPGRDRAHRVAVARHHLAGHRPSTQLPEEEGFRCPA